MKSSIRSLAGLVVLLCLTGGLPAVAAPNEGLDERIRILQEAFTRFEKDRQDLQVALKAEQKARKEAETALARALKQAADLEAGKEAADLRGEEAAQVIRDLESAREEAVRAAKEQEKAVRRLETEVERLKARNQSLERDYQKLKDRSRADQPEAGEPAEPMPEKPVARPAEVVEAAAPVPDTPTAESEGTPSLASARKLIAEGKIGEAETMLIGLTDTRRPDPAALTELGRLQMKQNRYPAAVETFQAAYRMDSRSTAILKDLALACHGAKQLPEAIRYLSKAVQLDSKDGEAHFNLAALYLMIPSPKVKEAASHYEKAIKLGEPRDEKLEAILFR